MDFSFYKNELEKIHTESFAWALRCCNHKREEAEDILQTAYLKVFEGKARFSHRSSFKTWWFAVIRHTAYDWNIKNLRSAERHKKAKIEKNHEVQDSAIEKLITLERAETFRAALLRLSSRQQEILQLVFYHDLTIEKAAEIMDITIGSARTHYKRGKQNIKNLLKNADIKK